MRGAKYRALTAQQIKPEGWLLRQLEIQAEGLSGHLDLVWPDIRESKWIGGDKEGWERVPYWLDGFIPLAYLLDDEDLKKRAKRYIDAILAAQKEDGWICPCALEERDRYDLWAAFLICKVLVLYQDCSGDERIEEAVYRALKQLLPHIARNTLFNWSAARWYECLIPILWMYERRPEPWLLQLMELLDADGIDYEKLYTYFDFQKPASKKYWTQTNHVVNTAMAFKCRALMSCLTEEDHFNGNVSYLKEIRAKSQLPILRKDFMIEEYQFYEAKAIGADAVLLITAILDDVQMHDFYQLARELELDVLVETHDEEEIERAMKINPRIIGVNNRNLKDFSITLETTKRLRPYIPKDKVFVTESGVMGDEDVRFLHECQVDAFLIGRAFMEAENPKALAQKWKEIFAGA